MARFVASGPTDEEIERVKAQAMAGFIRGIERIGGFGGKSDILARSQVYSGSPDAWKAGYDRIRKATAADVKAAVRRWLSDGVYILEVLPFPEYKAATAGADRSKMPDVGPAPAPGKNLKEVPMRQGTVIYLVDRPGSIQSMILAGQIVPPSANPDEIPFETMRTILGGMFISRVNMNLREDKHWTYGAGGYTPDARGQRPYLVYAPVQADKTKEAMQELAKEVRGIQGVRPVTSEELSAAKNSMTISLPGQWETNAAVEGSIARLATLNLRDDYYHTYPVKVNGVDAAAVVAAAQKLIRPEGFVWVVVGDRAKIEGGIKELGWGPIQLIDADGNPAK